MFFDGSGFLIILNELCVVELVDVEEVVVLILLIIKLSCFWNVCGVLIFWVGFFFSRWWIKLVNGFGYLGEWIVKCVGCLCLSISVVFFMVLNMKGGCFVNSV